MGDARVEFSWGRVRVFDEVTARVYHDICLEAPTARVKECRGGPMSSGQKSIQMGQLNM